MTTITLALFVISLAVVGGCVKQAPPVTSATQTTSGYVCPIDYEADASGRCVRVMAATEFDTP